MTFYNDHLSELEETCSLGSNETCVVGHGDRYVSEYDETFNMEYEYDEPYDVEHGEARNSGYEYDVRDIGEHDEPYAEPYATERDETHTLEYDETSTAERNETLDPEYAYETHVSEYDESCISEDAYDETYVGEQEETYTTEPEVTCNPEYTYWYDDTSVTGNVEPYAPGRFNNRFLEEHDAPPNSEYEYDEAYISNQETYSIEEEEETIPPTFSPLTIRGTRTDRITLVLLPMHGWPDWDFVTYLVEAHWQRQRDNNNALDPTKSLGAILVFRLRAHMLTELLDNHRAHKFECNGQVTWNYRSPAYRDALIAFCRHIYRDHRLQFNEQDTQPRFYATHRQLVRSRSRGSSA
ncbi:hypothetical protein BO86DRAFT_403282 [Aspergillus japonicus CBS 114.51]|uniref:Uncharacterized protein n=1 Tax=Aspergillus japonicus CBS 114.51 TaxID=1448312 RepID=A0A8T8WQL8_ASPJA|nr:hypothetical protein BO86DRAFT_403282 [Aspergillus japonicus CBS 114.51]RAH77862.1 hypothetical protein BO86DRAFT_403282 [Aspergillus japonicus CBS 114.51]